MGGTRAYGVGLGAAALVVGIAALLLDAAPLAVVAGAAGLAAALLLAAAVRAGDERAEVLAARIEELEAALVAAWERAAEAEKALVDAEATADPALTAEEVEALVDSRTGLYGEGFFSVTLTSRVAAARRHLRPVAVVLLEVASGVRQGLPSPADPALVATHVKATLREADTACHLDGSRFGLVLEDTPENGAVWTVERVRRALNAERKDLTLWAGVACYPAHAFDADELLARGTAALEAAREWRQDRIEVATTSEV